ncbi:hypothetical protein DWB79_02215 [Treponema medium]|uniref:Lipoprotein n=2 Tax=Treponema medium TaxID=58231 RepID=A0AA87TFP0_TREMD|nr:hypothetical protein [Treponema medium]EPF29736.1 hypothetical protein HMPREF9195_00440 [Treponema medium ATCC 700293]QSH96596.1 hypothetical protein DWB79_02215 [Treponema medium]
MKSKKTIAVLMVFSMVSAMMLAVFGCSDPVGRGSGGGISYTGTYAGVGEEDSGLGAWEFTIDAKGNLTGWFQVLTSRQSNCTGTIKSDGSFTASGKTALTQRPFTVDGTIAQDKKVNGTMQVSGLNTVSFSGSKK